MSFHHFIDANTQGSITCDACMRRRCANQQREIRVVARGMHVHRCSQLKKLKCQNCGANERVTSCSCMRLVHATRKSKETLLSMTNHRLEQRKQPKINCKCCTKKRFSQMKIGTSPHPTITPTPFPMMRPSPRLPECNMRCDLTRAEKMTKTNSTSPHPLLPCPPQKPIP